MITKILIGIVAVSTVFVGQYYFKSEKEQAQHTPVMSDIEMIDSPEELFYLGSQHFGGDDYDLTRARAAFTRQLMLSPTFSEFSWYQLGRIDFLEGDFRSAIFKFNEQISYFEDKVPNVYYMLGLTYGYLARETGSESDWEQAEKGFEKATEYFPEQPWPIVDLAWVYFSQGKYVEMHQLLQESIIEYADNPWYLNMFGLALLNTGSKEDAHEYFKLAAQEADLVTTEEWGGSYPGNDPRSWGKGLSEMREAIAHNLAVSAP